MPAFTAFDALQAAWKTPITEEFPNIPADYKLICGVSCGYATEHVVNTFNPGRRSYDENGSFGWSGDRGTSQGECSAAAGGGAGSRWPP